MRISVSNTHPLAPAVAAAMKRAMPPDDVVTLVPAMAGRAAAGWAIGGDLVLSDAEFRWLNGICPGLGPALDRRLSRVDQGLVVRGTERAEFAIDPHYPVDAEVLQAALETEALNAGVVVEDSGRRADAAFRLSFDARPPFVAAALLDDDVASYVYLFDPETGAQARAWPGSRGGAVLALVGDTGDADQLSRFAALLGARLGAALPTGQSSSESAGDADAASIRIRTLNVVGDAPAALGGELPAVVAAVEAVAGSRVAGALDNLRQALATVQRRRQHPRRNTADWFANWTRYAALPMPQFAVALATASQRVGVAEIAGRAPELANAATATLAGTPGTGTVPPAFAPFRLGGLQLANRVVVSPMCMYSARDGLPGDFHLVHLGARAMGGAGLLMTEMTAVSPTGRITPGCAGLYADAQTLAWRRIVKFVHTHSDAKIGVQLGHAGRKASTRLGWEGMDEPLEAGNWPIVAASALPYGPRNQIPRALDEAMMETIVGDYEAAAWRAIDAGFDLLEIHAAHGYLLSSFLSPVTNIRDDIYGGALENRLRFALRVLAAVRKIWAPPRPLTVRISAVDWIEGGNRIEDGVAIARALHAAGADAISVSSGQVSRQSRPEYGQMYQVPFSDRIRNEVGCPTVAVGAITTVDQVNTIIAAGRADLCALARPHLVDAAWTLRAAAELDVQSLRWPSQYLAGKAQLEREGRRMAG